MGRQATAVCLLLACLCIAPLLASPVADEDDFGTINPPSYYQRYRRSEYPADGPYFQWWYYWIHNARTHEHFYFRYPKAHRVSGRSPSPATA